MHKSEHQRGLGKLDWLKCRRELLMVSGQWHGKWNGYKYGLFEPDTDAKRMVLNQLTFLDSEQKH